MFLAGRCHIVPKSGKPVQLLSQCATSELQFLDQPSPQRLLAEVLAPKSMLVQHRWLPQGEAPVLAVCIHHCPWFRYIQFTYVAIEYISAQNMCLESVNCFSLSTAFSPAFHTADYQMTIPVPCRHLVFCSKPPPAVN